MTVIGGHQRLKVLKDLGITEVECIVVDLDKTNEKALNIALNKIQGDWDEDKLEALLQELKLEEFDMNLTGFDFDEVDEILNDINGDYPAYITGQTKNEQGRNRFSVFSLWAT